MFVGNLPEARRSSSKTPEAMKATQSGVILGIAMEDAATAAGLIKVRIMIQYVKM